MGLPGTNTLARREGRKGSGEGSERRMRGKNCSAHGAASTAEFNKRVEGTNGFPFKPCAPHGTKTSTPHHRLSPHSVSTLRFVRFGRRQDRILGGLSCTVASSKGLHDVTGVKAVQAL